LKFTDAKNKTLCSLLLIWTRHNLLLTACCPSVNYSLNSIRCPVLCKLRIVCSRKSGLVKAAFGDLLYALTPYIFPGCNTEIGSTFLWTIPYSTQPKLTAWGEVWQYWHGYTYWKIRKIWFHVKVHRAHNALWHCCKIGMWDPSEI
jgi:hypothetical protein